MKSAKAAILYNVGEPLEIEEVDYPDPEPGQVLVRIMASGVCHSDWHFLKGERPETPVPLILGHEGAGIVEAVGSGVTSIAEGDHVVLAWKRACGVCEMCQRGFPALCYHPLDDKAARPTKGGTPINKLLGLGTFATHTVVPVDVAIRVDKDIPFPQASLVACAVMTGVGAVINTARVEAGKSVAVFGCGGVGLNCIQGARLVGADPIIAVDIFDNKLEMARKFGATHGVNSSRENPVDRIKEITGGFGAHYAFEAIGVAEAPYVQSIACTRKRGVTIWIGHAAPDVNVSVNCQALTPEKTVMGSLYGTARPQIDFPRLLSLYKCGKLNLDDMISRTYDLKQVNEAFEALGRGEVARSVLMMS
jgi:S-(hydroxymethyl)glutathione dehydrogenase/alcohol dehydrogenase